MPQVLQANSELFLAKLVGRRENSQLCEALHTPSGSPVILYRHAKTRSLAIITTFEVMICFNTGYGADNKAIHNETISNQKECFQSNQDGRESRNVLKERESKDGIGSVTESFT